MKLKTLKDITIRQYQWEDDSFREVIKQEAIKWVKMDKNTPNSIQYTNLLHMFENLFPNGLKYIKSIHTNNKFPEIYGVDMWKAKAIIDVFIKYFFNITEEDLK